MFWLQGNQTLAGAAISGTFGIYFRIVREQIKESDSSQLLDIVGGYKSKTAKILFSSGWHPMFVNYLAVKR